MVLFFFSMITQNFKYFIIKFTLIYPLNGFRIIYVILVIIDAIIKFINIITFITIIKSINLGNDRYVVIIHFKYYYYCLKKVFYKMVFLCIRNQSRSNHKPIEIIELPLWCKLQLKRQVQFNI